MDYAIPTLEIENGQILTENVVILQYLADTFDQPHLLPPLKNFERYRVLEWLNYITTELHKRFSPLFNPALSEDIKVQIFKPALKEKFVYINQYLQNHTYLHDNQFTLPDAYLYVVTKWAIAEKIDLSGLSHLARYITMLNQHESIKKSLQEEGLSSIRI